MNKRILFFIILIAFITRLFLIWIGRPEFVGWFNHTYYYFVQTREVLESGKLAFPDMPFLFYLYAASAKILIWLGCDTHYAIVNASRFWMCVIPALIPIPVYAILRSIYKESKFPNRIWILVFISAFYPLTIVHHPEFLQKNMLGILLLAILILQSKILISQPNRKQIIVFIFIFILILLTHFGSAAASLLYVSAILISLWIHKRLIWSLWLSISLFVGLGFTFIVFYLLDSQRFERIGSYIDRIVDSSSVGLLFSADDPDKFTTVLILILPLCIVLLLHRSYKINRNEFRITDSTFWLANIFFFYLLLLPIYDPLLMARFMSYLTLSLLFIFAYMLKDWYQKIVWKKTLVGLAVFGTIFIATGDIVSLFMHNKNKKEAYHDLLEMKNKIKFNEKDLIITRNGVEHIVNWFLNSKSCLITSFKTTDFNKYNRIFIMNPQEGAMKLQKVTNKESQKYNYMLSNIKEPKNAILFYSSSQIKLWQITFPPKEWKFNSNGNWVGY